MAVAAELIAEVAGRARDQEERLYVDLHTPRFSYLVDLVAGFAPRRILDVGPGFQTELMIRTLRGAAVDTMGYPDLRFEPRSGRHIHVDLNYTPQPEQCAPPEPVYDLLVFAEVIEHLYAAPELVLGYLAQWLAPGGRLVVQTPNAASLFKRLSLLRGRNPYERLRLELGNPGHLREYTLDEMREIGAAAGLRLEGWHCANYFQVPGMQARLYGLACRLLPGVLANGLTVWFRK